MSTRRALAAVAVTSMVLLAMTLLRTTSPGSSPPSLLTRSATSVAVEDDGDGGREAEEEPLDHDDGIDVNSDWTTAIRMRMRPLLARMAGLDRQIVDVARVQHAVLFEGSVTRKGAPDAFSCSAAALVRMLTTGRVPRECRIDHITLHPRSVLAMMRASTRRRKEKPVAVDSVDDDDDDADEEEEEEDEDDAGEEEEEEDEEAEEADEETEEEAEESEDEQTASPPNKESTLKQTADADDDESKQNSENKKNANRRRSTSRLPGRAISFSTLVNVDLPGSDLRLSAQSVSHVEACAKACVLAIGEGCVGYTWQRTTGDCWLKRAPLPSTRSANACCISGTLKIAEQSSDEHDDGLNAAAAAATPGSATQNGDQTDAVDDSATAVMHVHQDVADELTCVLPRHSIELSPRFFAKQAVPFVRKQRDQCDRTVPRIARLDRASGMLYATQSDACQGHAVWYRHVRRVSDDKISFSEARLVPLPSPGSPRGGVNMSDTAFIHTFCSLESKPSDAAQDEFAAVAGLLDDANDMLQSRTGAPALSEKAIDNYDFLVPMNVKAEQRARQRSAEQRHRRVSTGEPFADRPMGAMNVLLYSIGSVSRARFHRELPETLRVLRKELADEADLFDFEGANTIGLDTTASMFGLLTGLPEDKLPEARRSFTNAKKLDNWGWLWKQLHKRGYVSAVGEDNGFTGAFQDRHVGFERVPTDYYMRPFWMATYQQRSGAKVNDFCRGNIETPAALANWTEAIYDRHRDVPKFSLTHATFASKGSRKRGRLRRGDATIAAWLRRMRTKRHLNNTLLVLFSDHGPVGRRSQLTFHGKLEQRNPALFILVPKWFSRQFPEAVAALRVNTKRLVTLFDVHATLRHMIKYPMLPGRMRVHQHSLFLPILRSRSCDQAGIAAHWCTCSRVDLETDVLAASPATAVGDHAKEEQAQDEQGNQLRAILLRGSGLVLDELNAMLAAADGKCGQLQMDTIRHAFVGVLPPEMTRFSRFSDRHGRSPVHTTAAGKAFSDSTSAKFYVVHLRTTSGMMLQAAFWYHVDTLQRGNDKLPFDDAVRFDMDLSLWRRLDSDDEDDEAATAVVNAARYQCVNAIPHDLVPICACRV